MATTMETAILESTVAALTRDEMLVMGMETRMEMVI